MKNIIDELKELRNQAEYANLSDEAKIIDRAITEIDSLRDELSKTQMELNFQNEINNSPHSRA